MRLYQILKYFLVLHIITIQDSNSQDINCDQLMNHRMNILNSYTNQKKLYKIRFEHIEDIKRLKTELLESNSWATSNTLSIIMGIKTANDIIDGILSMIPANQLKQVSFKSIKILTNTQNIKSMQDIAHSENIGEFAIHTSKLIGLDNIGFMFYELKNNLDNFKNQKILREELISQLNTIENEINKYNSTLLDTEKIKNDLSNYLMKIDAFLKENCKNHVKESPIDIESMLWNANNSSSSLEDYNYNLMAIINNPEYAQYFNIDDRFTQELNDLILGLNFGSNVSINNYIKEIENLLKKYLRDSDFTSQSSLNTTTIIPQKIETKPATIINSYSDFKKGFVSKSKKVKNKKAVNFNLPKNKINDRCVCGSYHKNGSCQ